MSIQRHRSTFDGFADDTISHDGVMPDTETAEREIFVPKCAANRWSQARRVNRADDWKEAAAYCSDLAINLYRSNGYDPHDPVFKSLCELGRIAYRRAGSRQQQLSARQN